MTDPFEEHRPMLLGLAYRLLGSMWDAEDVMQEAWLRWSRTDQTVVREPRGFLITVVSRLALDQLGSARVRREAYVGPWLPEPVATSSLGPLDTVELRDTVSYATLHLLERLTPPERAVFVLREAFALPYDEIAAGLESTAGACRQLHHRGSQRLERGTGRFTPTADEHAELLMRFLTAAGGGDFEALATLLSADVVSWNDGGGQVRAALRPIQGRDAVIRFLAGLAERYPVTDLQIIDVNGLLGVLLVAGEQRQFLTLGIRGALVHDVFNMRNPDKLGHVGV